ncbi:hypothetical protein ACFT3O_25740 [Streptomyces cinereoruber]|uniref:hypothetical protein n=1 Tax=Streptomyces cinereoruber TaxID=67260 RepID=UPI0036326F91
MYKHDAQGRLVRRTHKLLDGQRRAWTFTWSAEDRLTVATTPDGDHWRYAYDPLGRRTAEHRHGPDGRIEERTTFTWDGTRLVEEARQHDHRSTWDYRPGTHRPPGADRPSQSGRVRRPVPRDRDRPGRHPDGRIARQHHTTVYGLRRLPPSFSGTVKRRGNRPRLRLLPLLRRRCRRVRLGRPARPERRASPPCVRP